MARSSNTSDKPEPEPWAADRRELEARRQAARAMGGGDAVARQHAAGKGTARDRLDGLFDDGRFREMGLLSGKADHDDAGQLTGVTPSNAVIGVGLVAGRRVVAAADDFTIRGGSSEAAIAEKWIFSDRYAMQHRLPIVRLIDSAGGSIKLLDKLGHTKIPGYAQLPLTALLGAVPVVGIAMGACAGLGAVRVGAAHLSIMVRGKAQVFAGGPPVVKQALGLDIDKEALGGYDSVHRKSGAVQLAAKTEAEALAAARRFLSYLPQNVWEAPQRTPCDDPEDRQEAMLAGAIPENPRQTFNPRPILEVVFDLGSVFELSSHFGGSLITALARLNGWPVGVMINDPRKMGGALTRAAAKMERFVDLCDTFHLPIVNLVDQPGVMTGPEAEAEGTLVAAIRAMHAIEQSTVPWLSLVIRRCVGLAGGMLGPLYGGDGHVLPNRYAWPSARWGFSSRPWSTRSGLPRGCRGSRWCPSRSGGSWGRSSASISARGLRPRGRSFSAPSPRPPFGPAR